MLAQCARKRASQIHRIIMTTKRDFGKNIFRAKRRFEAESKTIIKIGMRNSDDKRQDKRSKRTNIPMENPKGPCAPFRTQLFGKQKQVPMTSWHGALPWASLTHPACKHGLRTKKYPSMTHEISFCLVRLQTSHLLVCLREMGGCQAPYFVSKLPCAASCAE